MMNGGLAQLGQDNSVPLWMVVTVAAMTIVYTVVRPMFRKKDPLEKQPFRLAASQQRSVERQMENLLVQMSEMARQISAQLETRTTKLEVLLREADEKIAALKSGGMGMPNPPAASAALPEPPDPRYVEIYALADQGRSAGEIAQQLQRHKGEIELILALRPR